MSKSAYKAKSKKSKPLPMAVRAYMSEMGRRGGLRSKRALTAEQAAMMVRVREAKKAYKKYHAQCFWSFDPNFKITSADIIWVGEQLMKNGNQQLWVLGRKLCL